ncbi:MULTISPECIES: helix-turn-helix domain-containing protein [Sphingobacterium]|uniref:helix-turn-helix domain-containing protein n=1 Tax=Sphingobacterium TaxID=28453 RepID=UPI001044E4B0|nr:MULTISPECIES: helix-turn-helix transcriptional regulator [Sphingobacterium]MCW2261696.1 transcriptional regulator with XRE-family HTH domain [Sphingobacterium kitahiroshimense]TCR10007.1 helix-turn-helix protein [Sphingobacterium sp. JUb78]
MGEKQYRDQQYLKELGKQIKKIREDNGWSQEFLAELCEIDVRQLGRIERAETNSTISILKKIADKSNIKMNKLLDF